MDGHKMLIGRRDRIDLPGLGYRNVKAKVDTGAYGSAIHCSEIDVIFKGKKQVLSFVLLDANYSGYKNKKCYFDHFTDKLVKSSSGEIEHRYTIITEVVIFGQTIETEFSLTDRSKMKYPILLGRKFLLDRFIVDVSLKELSFKLNKIKKIKKLKKT